MKISNGVNAKKKTLIAIAIMTLFFPVFVSAVDNVQWGVAADSSGNISIGIGSGGYGGWSLANPYGLPGGSIYGIISNLLFWLLAIFSVLGILGFVIAGIIYLVSAGDEDMISKAKKAMTWSIVGVIVGLSGFLIMQAVAALLNGGSRF